MKWGWRGETKQLENIQRLYKYEICVYMSNIYVMHICKLRGRKDKSLASQKK